MEKNFHLNANLHKSIISYMKLKLKSSSKMNQFIDSFFEFKDHESLIKHHKSSYHPVLFRGFEGLFYEKQKERLQNHFPLLVGKWNLDQKFEVIIGETLLKKIVSNASKQKEILKNISQKIPFFIDILSFSIQNENSNELIPLSIFKLNVVGIFKSSYELYDNIIFSHLRTSNILFKEDSNFKSVSLGFFLKDINQLKQAKNEIRKLFFPLFIPIKDWEARNSSLNKTFAWEKEILSIIVFIMLLTSIITTLYIHINLFFFKKRYSFAILRAIGIGHYKIYSIMLVLGSLIIFLSLLLGNIISLIFLYGTPLWKIFLQFFFSSLSAIYPNNMSLLLKLLNNSHFDWNIFIKVNILSILTLIISLLLSIRKISETRIIKNLKMESKL